jgi:hypothetical protein
MSVNMTSDRDDSELAFVLLDSLRLRAFLAIATPSSALNTGTFVRSGIPNPDRLKWTFFLVFPPVGAEEAFLEALRDELTVEDMMLVSSVRRSDAVFK